VGSSYCGSMGSSGSKKARANDHAREESAPPVERGGVVSGGVPSGSGGGGAEVGVAAAAQDGAPAQQDEASEEFVIVEPECPAAVTVGSANAAAPAAVVDDEQAESAAAVEVGCAVAVAAAAVVDEEQTEGAGPAAVARVGATAVDDAIAEGADPVAVGSGLGAIGAVRGDQSMGSAIQAARKDASATVATADPSGTPCKWFFGAAAWCQYGDACAYSHDQAVKDRELAAVPSLAAGRVGTRATQRAAQRAEERAAQRAAGAESALAEKYAPLFETLLRCSHASATQGSKGSLVRRLANLVYGPKEFITIQGLDRALRWYTHNRAAALGLETETKNRGRRPHGTADVVVRKPQGWAMRTLDQVATALATALEAEGPRHSGRKANKARKRAKIDAWRGRCYECGCEVDAHEAAISLSFEGHYCSVCIELPEYEGYKWEGAAEGGRLYNDHYDGDGDFYNDHYDDDGDFY
jgi:hypothetical protein